VKNHFVAHNNLKRNLLKHTNPTAGVQWETYSSKSGSVRI